MNSRFRTAALSAFAFALITLLFVPRVKADDWLPIVPEELKMTSHPAAPGAPAIILYRQYETDDNEVTEYTYKRIKVLTEEGKKYANIEIPYDRGYYRVIELRGRTIHPDGSIVNFDGKTYDKVVYKQGKVKIQVKSFNLPDVQVGSIVEYKYKLKWEEGYASEPEWIVQDDLFEKQAKFRYTPYKGEVIGSRAFAGTRVQWTIMLPKGVEPKAKGMTQGSAIELDMNDVPAFIEEPYMPPADALHQRVRFFYFDGDLKSVDEYWQRYGREWSGNVDKFANQKKVSQQTAETVGSEQDPEQKLRKIYARIQQVRNLSYERNLSKEEVQKLNLKDNKGADDVLHQNLGFSSEIARTFLAMARAAGVEAYMARVTRRDELFFEKNIPDFRQLKHEVVIVNLKGKEVFLDPGTRFAPYGLVYWKFASSAGVRQTAKHDIGFVATPASEASEAVTQRVADLTLSPSGDLQGKLTLTFTGQEALSKRLDALETDEAGRNKDLEDEVKRWIPAGALVKVESSSGWNNASEPLVAQLSINAPGYATATGKRMVMSTGIFQSASKSIFPHAERVQAIVFPYPYGEKDEVKIALPAGMQVEALPKDEQLSVNYVDYRWQHAKDANTLNLKRDFSLKMITFRPEDYRIVKSFFDVMKSTDDEQAILRGGGNVSGQ